MTTSEQRFSALTCPACGASLTDRESALRCTACSETVPVVDDIPQFPVDVEGSDAPAIFDTLSSIYETPLWFPVMYRIIGGPFAPLDDREKVAELLDGDGESVFDEHSSAVLDVACGTGRFTRYVADDAAIVWGIDVSEGMLQRARRYTERDGLENVQFARMDAENLQFEDSSFEGISCCWALHLFPDIPAVAEEISRVLEPGGRFAGTTLSGNYILSLPGAQQGIKQAIGARVFDRDELRELLSTAGFTDFCFERRGAALFFSARVSQ